MLHRFSDGIGNDYPGAELIEVIPPVMNPEGRGVSPDCIRILRPKDRRRRESERH